MLLTDGLAGDQQEIVRGALQRRSARACRSSAAARATTSRCRPPSSCTATQVLRNAVVGAAIASDAPLGNRRPARLARASGEPMLVTSSADNRVLLARRPARARRLPGPARRAAEARDRPRRVHPVRAHPPARARPPHAARSRSASSARPTSRTARSAASPRCRRAGSRGSWKATTTRCSPRPMPPAATRWRRSAAAPPLGLIAFDCIARRGVLGDAGIATRGGPHRRARRRRAGRGLLHVRRDRAHARDQRVPQPDPRRPRGRVSGAPLVPQLATSWSAQQLAEFLALVSACDDEAERQPHRGRTRRRGARRRGGRDRARRHVVASIGFTAGRCPSAEIFAAARGEAEHHRTSPASATARC